MVFPLILPCFNCFVSGTQSDQFLTKFAGFHEFSLLAALHPLQYTATEFADPTTAASAGPELSESENPLHWLRRCGGVIDVMGYNLLHSATPVVLSCVPSILP